MRQAIQSAYGKADSAKPEQAQIKIFIRNSLAFISLFRNNKERRHGNDNIYVKNQANEALGKIHFSHFIPQQTAYRIHSECTQHNPDKKQHRQYF